MLKAFFRLTLMLLLLLAMTSLGYAAGSFRQGDEGAEIELIQSKLNALGYQAGAVDGEFGELTTAAVKAFQKDNGLEPDGIVGAVTYKALLGRDLPVSRAASGNIARIIIQQAFRYIGVPYVYGGSTPSGFDCSGFIRYIYAKGGIGLPRTADAQYEVGKSISVNNLQPGDIVYFNTYAPGASHNGIYIGEGKFIHASSSRGVTTDRLADSYWRTRYIGARRVL